MRTSIRSVLLIAALAACPQPVAPTQEHFWLIVPGERIGPVYADSSAEGLRAALGDAAVVDRDIGIGEGEFAPGTILFPDDPSQRLAIIWHDSESRRRPARVIVCYDADSWGAADQCRWRVNGLGIGIGTRLSTLEALNAGPFALTGFEWDYSGTVTSWNGGQLAEILEPDGWKLWVRLTPEVDDDGNWVPAMSYEEVAPVLGDHDLSSDHPILQKLDPAVYWLGIEFP